MKTLNKSFRKMLAVVIAVAVVFSMLASVTFGLGFYDIFNGTGNDDIDGGNGGTGGSSTENVASMTTWDGTVATKYAGGIGTQADPYLISTGAELAYLRVDTANGVSGSTTKGKYYKMTNDIDLDSKAWTPIGVYYLGTDHSKAFYGNFDGNNFSLHNLNINKTTDGIGFFGGAYSASISNLTIASGTVKGGKYNTGGFVGKASASKFYNLTNHANISSGSQVGGIIGGDMDSTYDSLVNYGTIITPSEIVGGIVGVTNANVSNAANYGNVTGGSKVGGIVGQGRGNTVSNTVNYGAIYAKSSSILIVAGIAFDKVLINGYNAGKITAGASTSNISSVGGVAGSNNLYALEGTHAKMSHTVTAGYSGAWYDASGNKTKNAVVGTQNEHVKGTIQDSLNSWVVAENAKGTNTVKYEMWGYDANGRLELQNSLPVVSKGFTDKKGINATVPEVAVFNDKYEIKIDINNGYHGVRPAISITGDEGLLTNQVITPTGTGDDITAYTITYDMGEPTDAQLDLVINIKLDNNPAVANIANIVYKGKDKSGSYQTMTTSESAWGKLPVGYLASHATGGASTYPTATKPLSECAGWYADDGLATKAPILDDKYIVTRHNMDLVLYADWKVAEFAFENAVYDFEYSQNVSQEVGLPSGDTTSGDFIVKLGGSLVGDLGVPTGVLPSGIKVERTTVGGKTKLVFTGTASADVKSGGYMVEISLEDKVSGHIVTGTITINITPKNIYNAEIIPQDQEPSGGYIYTTQAINPKFSVHGAYTDGGTAVEIKEFTTVFGENTNVVDGSSAEGAITITLNSGNYIFDSSGVKSAELIGNFDILPFNITVVDWDMTGVMAGTAQDIPTFEHTGNNIYLPSYFTGATGKRIDFAAYVSTSATTDGVTGLYAEPGTYYSHISLDRSLTASMRSNYSMDASVVTYAEYMIRIKLDTGDITVEVQGVPDGGFVYTGKPITPIVKVANSTGSGALIPESEYRLTYNNNRNAGVESADIVINFAVDGSIYGGTVIVKFTIKKAQATAVWSDLSRSYNGKAQTPTATIDGLGADGTITLDVVAANAIDVAEYSAKALLEASGTHAGNYDLSNTTTKFNIVVFDITNEVIDITFKKNKYVYNGIAQKPEIATIMVGVVDIMVDGGMSITYKDNINARVKSVANAPIMHVEYADGGNISGKFDYKFTIAKATITVTWENLLQEYDGTAKFVNNSFTIDEVQKGGFGASKMKIVYTHYVDGLEVEIGAPTSGGFYAVNYVIKDSELAKNFIFVNATSELQITGGAVEQYVVEIVIEGGLIDRPYIGKAYDKTSLNIRLIVRHKGQLVSIAGEFITWTFGENTSVGMATIKVDILKNGVIGSAEVSFNIVQAVVEIVWEGEYIIKDYSDRPVGYYIDANGDKIILTDTEVDATIAGEIKVGSLSNPNYVPASNEIHKYAYIKVEDITWDEKATYVENNTYQRPIPMYKGKELLHVAELEDGTAIVGDKSIFTGKYRINVLGYTGKTYEIRALTVDLKDDNGELGSIESDLGFAVGTTAVITREMDTANINVTSVAEGFGIGYLVDIEILLGGVPIVTNGETYSVKLKIPEGIDAGATIKMVFVTDDKETVELLASEVVDGYITFDITHFSYYGIITEQEVSGSVWDKVAGIASDYWWVILLIVLAIILLIILIIILTGKKYYIVFNGNGSSKGVMHEQKCKMKKYVCIATNRMIRKDYKFVGWSRANTGEGELIADKQKVSALSIVKNERINLYAQWQQLKCMVKFVTNGGSIIAPVVLNYGDRAMASEATNRDGFEFGGWHTDASMNVAFDLSSPVTADISVFAKWDKIEIVVEKVAVSVEPKHDNSIGIFEAQLAAQTLVMQEQMKAQQEMMQLQQKQMQEQMLAQQKMLNDRITEQLAARSLPEVPIQPQPLPQLNQPYYGFNNNMQSPQPQIYDAQGNPIVNDLQKQQQYLNMQAQQQMYGQQMYGQQMYGYNPQMQMPNQSQSNLPQVYDGERRDGMDKNDIKEVMSSMMELMTTNMRQIFEAQAEAEIAKAAKVSLQEEVDQDMRDFEKIKRNMQQEEQKHVVADEIYYGGKDRRFVIPPVKVVMTKEERYNMLDKSQKRRYDKLFKMVSDKVETRTTNSEMHDNFKIGSSQLLKITINANVIIAHLLIPNDGLSKYERDTDIKLKQKPVLVNVTDEKSLSTVMDIVEMNYITIIEMRETIKLEKRLAKKNAKEIASKTTKK